MTPGPDTKHGGVADKTDSVQLLVDTIVDVAIFTLDVEGRVTSWSPGAQRMKGYAADEIVGRHFSAFYTEEDVAAGKPARALAIAAASGQFKQEGWRRRKDGSRLWADVVITALHDEQGRLVGFGKVTRDLSERKREEDALRASEERLRHREREAAQLLHDADRAKQDLVAMVAHDLRAPIGIVHGAADLLLEDWDRLSEESRRALLTQIASSSDRLRALVEDVVDVARIEAGQLRYDLGRVDLVALVERLVVEVDPTRRRLAVVRPDGEVTVHADEQRVWQILMNLVSNALKFSAETEPVEIAVALDGDMARVSVRDHGPGIAPADQARLFQRFSRLPPARGARPIMGSGLGLFIARSFVTAQGGRIWVDSQPDQGATFAFTLPRPLSES